MQLAQGQSWEKTYIATIKSFLIWSFTLLVSFLVVGFPIVVLMVTIGALMTIILQSVLPISSVLLVAGSIIGMTILAVFMSAALLTVKGIHPQDVTWLRWLHGDAQPSHSSVYAACPLTCELTQ